MTASGHNNTNRRKKERLKAITIYVIFMAVAFLFFAEHYARAESSIAIQITKDQDIHSPETYTTIEKAEEAKQKQQKYIENINDITKGKNGNLTYRYNLDGSLTITDKKEGVIYLFDKNGKAISSVDVKTGEKTDFKGEDKKEGLTKEMYSPGMEYADDKEGVLLDIVENEKDGEIKKKAEEITEKTDVAKETKALLEKGDKKKTLIIDSGGTEDADFGIAEKSIIERVLSAVKKASVFTKEVFMKIAAWLRLQANNIVNCATDTLNFIIGTQTQVTKEKLAEQMLLFDILGGVINENTEGKLQTSMYAIKKAAMQNGVELIGAKLTYEELTDSFQLSALSFQPVICHLKSGHYIVVSNVNGEEVTYIDSKGNQKTISKYLFISQWSGNVLCPSEILHNTQHTVLSDEELKQIKGSGTTAYYNFDDGTSPEENGFTVGTTADGSVLTEEDAEYGGYSVKICGNDSPDSLTYMEKTFLLEDDGEATFYWKVSSEDSYDYLKFYIDGVQQDETSGETDWEKQTYSLTEGEHTLRWEYKKDGSMSEGADAGWVDEISITEIASEEELPNDTIVDAGDYIGVKYTGYLEEDGSVFDSNEDSDELFYFTVSSGQVIEGFNEAVLGLALGEKITVTIPPEKAYGLEGSHPLAGKTLIFDIQVMEINSQQSVTVGETPYNCGFDDGTSPEENGFTVGTTADGSVITEEDAEYGGYSVKIWGNDSPDSLTYMEKSFLLEEDGKVTFYWKVSSEDSYDYLKFYINSVLQDEISGETEWAYQTYNLTAGEHTLRWEYAKDSSQSDGLDAGWVDNISVAKNKAEKSSCVDAGDYIGVKYTGYLEEDGSVFDSNEDSDELFYFTVSSGQVIEGFNEAVLGLALGEKITVTIPPEKAYGLEGSHSLAGKTLIFDIQLMEIKNQQLVTVDAVPYNCGFEDGTSPKENNFTVGTTADGGVLTEEDAEYGGYSAKIWGNDSPDSATYMEKSFLLEGDGEATFYWKVSSEDSYDYLRFYIDDVQQDEISGETEWAYQTYSLTAGEHTLRWEYEKDSSQSDGSDGGWVDDINISTEQDEIDWDEIFKNLENNAKKSGKTNHPANTPLLDLSDLLSNDGLSSPPDSSGGAPGSFGEVHMAVPQRFIAPQEMRLNIAMDLYDNNTSHFGSVKHIGGSSAAGEQKTERTATSYVYVFDDAATPENNGFEVGNSGGGSVSMDSETAYNNRGYSMKLRGNDSAQSTTYAEKTISLENAGELSFLWKVSSETGQDALKFYIDGILQDEISGEKEWEEKKYILTKGKHILTWGYEKNTEVSKGKNAGWIDEIMVKITKKIPAAIEKVTTGKNKNVKSKNSKGSKNAKK